MNETTDQAAKAMNPNRIRIALMTGVVVLILTSCIAWLQLDSVRRDSINAVSRDVEEASDGVLAYLELTRDSGNFISTITNAGLADAWADRIEGVLEPLGAGVSLRWTEPGEVPQQWSSPLTTSNNSLLLAYNSPLSPASAQQLLPVIVIDIPASLRAGLALRSGAYQIARFAFKPDSGNWLTFIDTTSAHKPDSTTVSTQRRTDNLSFKLELYAEPAGFRQQVLVAVAIVAALTLMSIFGTRYVLGVIWQRSERRRQHSRSALAGQLLDASNYGAALFSSDGTKLLANDLFNRLESDFQRLHAQPASDNDDSTLVEVSAALFHKVVAGGEDGRIDVERPDNRVFRLHMAGVELGEARYVYIQLIELGALETNRRAINTLIEQMDDFVRIARVGRAEITLPERSLRLPRSTCRWLGLGNDKSGPYADFELHELMDSNSAHELNELISSMTASSQTADENSGQMIALELDVPTGQFSVQMLLNPIRNEEERVSEMMVLIVDQTLLLRALASANASEQERSQFIRNMNHELRTPMNALVGYSELLAHNNELPPEQRKLVDGLRRAVKELMSRIESALNFKQTDAGRTDTPGADD